MNNFVTTNSDIEKVLFGVRDILRELDVSVYDPDTNTVFVRNIDVRRSETNDGMIITLVTHNKDDVKLLELSGLITEKLHNVNGIILNFNPHKTNEILGKKISLFGAMTLLKMKSMALASRSHLRVSSNQTAGN